MTQSQPHGTIDHDHGVARGDVDAWEPPWPTFAAFMEERADDDNLFLEWRGEGSSNRSWTGGAWVSHVKALAGELKRQRLRPGDEVAMIADNRPEMLLTAFAAWWPGGVFVPLDPRDTRQRHSEAIELCERPRLAQLVTADPGTTATTKSQSPELSIPDLLSGVDLPISRAVAAPGVPISAPALRLHTSGTSGTPKAFVHGMRELLISCAAMRDAFGWGPSTRTLSVLPISHANGLLINSFLSWFAGGSSVLRDRFCPATFWQTARETRASTCSLVPTVLEYLLEVPAEQAPATMREVFSGSGPTRPQAATQFEQRYAVPVRQLYDVSEISVLTATPPLPVGALEGHTRGSIGPAVPHVEMAVIDHRRECDEGERSELVARGGTLMFGYAGRPDATATALSGGWFHTGDRGYWLRGADGLRWYYLEGRMREMISRAASTIMPQVVDDVLCEHPAVDRAATNRIRPPLVRRGDRRMRRPPQRRLSHRTRTHRVVHTTARPRCGNQKS